MRSAEIVAKLDLGDRITSADADVLIDFSSAAAAEAVCDAAVKSSAALVIGTTGHSAKEKQAIETAAQKIPVVFASNFSIGVNALFSLTEQAAKILGENFDLEIVETHHRLKERRAERNGENAGRNFCSGPQRRKIAARARRNDWRA